VSEVDDLRSQLRTRGYLTHGIERWFALDPWSSRAFWLELVLVALKAGTLIAAFAALPMTAVMLFRNSPLTAFETLALFLTYAAAWLLFSFLLVIVIALLLKLRPALPIETPRALLGISLGASALLVLPIALWWYRFDTGPATGELLAGIALTAIFFLIATIVISAALLSFSIYEVHRVPAIHQKPRTIPMTVAAAALIALLFLPAYAARDREAIEPMVVVSQTTSRVALVAVDGLTNEILQSRPDLAQLLSSTALPTIAGASTTERWASLGTGVPTTAHGVRAIEGVRFRGGRHILQRVSRSEVVLMTAAPLLRIARREPLPPTVRRRDYVWEISSERGIPSLSVNWWTTADERAGALTSIAQEEIFNASKGDPLRLDELAATRFVTELDRRSPRFATVYLPALDVILNRARLDQTTQLARSIRVLDNLTNVIRQLRDRGYDVLVIGLPGDHQLGQAVLASNLRLEMPASPWDLAPTILTLLGFPLSREMPGRALRGTLQEPRIASYGRRHAAQEGQTVNEEYYENLRSLGYIR
jgi:hypothetical protein